MFFIRALKLRRQARARMLFRFWDGSRWRYGDPFRIWRRIVNDEKFNVQNHGPLADAGMEPETTYCIEAVCAAFGVEQFSDQTGRGLTDQELLDLLAQLANYLNALKKNTASGPISPAPTDSPSCNSSPTSEQAATSSQSDYGSTSTAPKPVEPTSSCVASKEPSAPP
jgi:hypothetical protein